MKRVVITGAGTINALGPDVPSTLEAMREGRCGIGELDADLRPLGQLRPPDVVGLFLDQPFRRGGLRADRQGREDGEVEYQAEAEHRVT